MATQLQFYENVSPLSAEKHGDLSVKMGTDYSFADKATAVLLTATEFRHAAYEYCIVFAGSEDAPLPTVVLGAGPEQNLYVDDEGQWGSRYVPAAVRRYPFVFASGSDQNTFALCVDEDYSGCNREGRGERLFDADGQRTEYLQRMLGFQQAFQAEFEKTRLFAAKIHELELLEPIQAQVRGSSGESRTLTGMRAVNRDKLHALDGDTLAEMARTGMLECVYLHLHSLNNLRMIGEKLTPEGVEATADNTIPKAKADAKGDAAST